MEEKLVAEIKRVRPTLKGMVPILRKYGFGEMDKMKEVFFKHNLVNYVNKGDPVMKKIRKQTSKEVKGMYKEMRNLKFKKTRKR